MPKGPLTITVKAEGIPEIAAVLTRYREALERIREIGRTARGLDELEECVSVANDALSAASPSNCTCGGGPFHGPSCPAGPVIPVESDGSAPSEHVHTAECWSNHNAPTTCHGPGVDGGEVGTAPDAEHVVPAPLSTPDVETPAMEMVERAWEFAAFVVTNVKEETDEWRRANSWLKHYQAFIKRPAATPSQGVDQ